MSRLKQFVEKQKKLSRFQLMKSLFTSFVMTVTVVVVAVMVIPASPKGKILDIDRFTNSIVYSVQITDPDSAIIEDTLKILLVNQSETYEQIISVGDTTGVFEELSAETQYTIKILADKGFGSEVLDSVKFYTEENTGGAITAVNLQEPYDYQLSYNIDYFISNPFNEYTAIQLRYGYKYQDQEEVTSFTTVSLNDLEHSVVLENIPNSNIEVHLYLEAINQQSEVIVLDMLVIRTPYQIYGSFHISQVGSRQLSVSLYPDMTEGLDVDYEVVLKRSYQEIDRQAVEFADMETEFHHEGTTVIFSGLRPDVEYTLLLYATFVHPYTLVKTEQLLYTEIVTTLGNYSSSIVFEEFDYYYEAYITLDDPNDIYDIAYVTIHEVTESGNFFFTKQIFDYQMLDDEKQFVVYIEKPLLNHFIIEIGIGDSMVYYNYSILKEIEKIGGIE